MFSHIGYGVALISATTLIHFMCTVAVIKWVRPFTERDRIIRRASILAAVIVTMTVVAILESSLWAVFYVWVGALENLEQALYFSLVTFTTLGYGDIHLDVEWRILSAVQAANGVIIFGWTTAIIVAVAQRAFGIHPSSASRS